MPSTLDLIRDAQINITDDRIAVEISGGSARVGIGDLDVLIRALEGIRYMVVGEARPTVDATRPHTDGATAADTSTYDQSVAPSVAPVRAPGTRGDDEASPSAPAKAPSKKAEPAAKAKKEAAKKPTKRKRRSRKRVGDALVKWMKKNPGWHSVDYLLDIVITHKMTDASPKRALKIALGKQRGDVFQSDAEGAHWRLVDDTGAGRAPSGKGAKGRKASAKKKDGRSAKRTRASRKKDGQRGDEASGADGEDGRGDDASHKPILVKRGEDRAEKVVSPGEREARKAKAEALEQRRAPRGRWRTSRDEVERARRNLLGLGAAPSTSGGDA